MVLLDILRRRTSRPLAALWMSVWIALVAPDAARGQGAQTRTALVESFETAAAVVVAEVSRVTPLEHGAYLAALDIESVLIGPAALPNNIEIAWEEPALSLPARLRRQQRIVVALEAVGSASIWRQRIPDVARRNAVLSIAGRGSAYFDRPSAADVSALAHYLALSPAAREGDAGVAHLARIAASASPAFAIASLRRLDALATFDSNLTPTAATALTAAVLRLDGEATRCRA